MEFLPLADEFNSFTRTTDCYSIISFPLSVFIIIRQTFWNTFFYEKCLKLLRSKLTLESNLDKKKPPKSNHPSVRNREVIVAAYVGITYAERHFILVQLNHIHSLIRSARESECVRAREPLKLHCLKMNLNVTKIGWTESFVSRESHHLIPITMLLLCGSMERPYSIADLECTYKSAVCL